MTPSALSDPMSLTAAGANRTVAAADNQGVEVLGHGPLDGVLKPFGCHDLEHDVMPGNFRGCSIAMASCSRDMEMAVPAELLTITLILIAS